MGKINVTVTGHMYVSIVVCCLSAFHKRFRMYVTMSLIWGCAGRFYCPVVVNLDTLLYRLHIPELPLRDITCHVVVSHGVGISKLTRKTVGRSYLSMCGSSESRGKTRKCAGKSSKDANHTGAGKGSAMSATLRSCRS